MKDIEGMVNARGASYGPPKENHDRTAMLWSAYFRAKYKQYPDMDAAGLAENIDRDDVCFLNILQKIARCQSEAGVKGNEDGIKDIQGYAENLLIMNFPHKWGEES